MFPGCPAYLSKPAAKKRNSPTKKRKLESVHQNTQAPKRRKKNKDLSASNNFTNEHNAINSDNAMPSVYDSQNRELLFSSIFEFQTKIFSPLSWSRQNIYAESIRAIQFTQWIVKKQGIDDIETVCTKQILIDENMTIRINVMGRRLKFEDFGLKSNVALTVNDIENIIKIVGDRKICSGCAEIGASENIITSFTCRDKEGYLRHTSCPLILPKEISDCSDKTNDKCKFCSRAKHTLNQKLVRIQKSKEIVKKYLKFKNLSPQTKKKIQSLRDKLKVEAKGKIRAQHKISLLKKTVKSCQQKIADIQTENLNKILDNQECLSRNEKIAITEMFAAARKKNPKLLMGQRLIGKFGQN